MTIAEKIIAKKAGKKVKAGDIVFAKVDVAMSHENSRLVKVHFEKIGVKKVWDKEKIVIIFDHRIPAESEKTASLHKEMREFVKEQDIKHFYDINYGICHQILAEQGFSLPGILMVGTDSHTTTAGAFGAFATGIGATEMATVWATGEIWLRVPESIKIIVRGKLKKGVYAKDLILYIIGKLKADGANYKSVEFYGEIIKNFSIASRMVLANLSMEMGAKAAIVPPDDKTLAYIEKIKKLPYEIVLADKDAEYSQIIEIDAEEIDPQIACPHSVDNVKSVKEVEGTKINQAVLGSCTNGRLEDLEIAARILKNKKIHKDVRMIVVPASWQIYLEAIRKGIIETFIKAGAVIINPGCGPCLGAHQGLLADNEVAITTTNRNFQARMGSPNSYIYLASPATVAVSAITGVISNPIHYL